MTQVRRDYRWNWLVLAALLVASPAAAADAYRARALGDWTVAASADGMGCFLTRQYDGVGATTLMLGLDTDGGNHLSVLNDNWSIAPQERLQLDFRLTNGGYTRQRAIGMVADGKKGFVTTFEPKFPGYFATSTALHIARGATPVAQLSLAGSGAAVAELRRCVDAQRVTASVRPSETAGSDSIPRDPFAAAPKRRAKR